MTRGTLYFISDKNILESTEFNGGMYMDDDGYGEDVVKILLQVKTEKNFWDEVRDFNKENFQYSEQVVHNSRRDICEETAINFRFTFKDSDYFDKFFSDYLFFKNESDKKVTFKQEMKGDDNETIILEKGDVAVFNYGKFVKIYKSE